MTLTLPINIREFQYTDDDYEQVAAIDNTIFPEYQSSPKEWRYNDEKLDTTRYTRKRFVAEDPGTGRAVGWGEYSHSVHYFHPQRFNIWVEALPERQRQGIGTALYERLLQDLAELDARQLQSQVKETMPESVRFLEKRDFQEISREWESRINPQEFDPTTFQHYLDGAAQEGIKITTLAEVRESDPDWLQKLYDMHISVERDIPSPNEYTPATIEHFRDHEVDSPGSMPEGFFIARHGDLYVGESYLGRTLTGPSPLWQGLTGVRREYRGKGIAFALKLKVLEYARREGYDMLKTWNSILNQPMLAINVKLGFVLQPAWVELELVVSG